VYLVKLKVTHAVNQPSLIVSQNKDRFFLSCLSLCKTHQLPAGYRFSLFLIFPYLLFFNTSPTAYLIFQYLTQSLPYIAIPHPQPTLYFSISPSLPHISIPHTESPLYFNTSPTAYPIFQYLTQSLPYISISYPESTLYFSIFQKPYNRGPINHKTENL
jgi:hypothetical protein